MLNFCELLKIVLVVDFTHHLEIVNADKPENSVNESHYQQVEAQQQTNQRQLEQVAQSLSQLSAKLQTVNEELEQIDSQLSTVKEEISLLTQKVNEGLNIVVERKTENSMLGARTNQASQLQNIYQGAFSYPQQPTEPSYSLGLNDLMYSNVSLNTDMYGSSSKNWTLPLLGGGILSFAGGIFGGGNSIF